MQPSWRRRNEGKVLDTRQGCRRRLRKGGSPVDVKCMFIRVWEWFPDTLTLYKENDDLMMLCGGHGAKRRDSVRVLMREMKGDLKTGDKMQQNAWIRGLFLNKWWDDVPCG